MTFPAIDLVGTVRPFWVAYLDFTGDPVRITTLPKDTVFTGTGDAELDGLTFDSVPEGFLSISDVNHSEAGADSVSASLSGIPGGDDGLIAAIAAPANWRGKVCRMWRGLADASFLPITIEHYYTGYMMSVGFSGDETTQTISATIENYLAVLTTPRGRTYQDQREFDGSDVSAERIRAAANGIQTAVGVAGGGGGGGGINRVFEQAVRLK